MVQSFYLNMGFFGALLLSLPLFLLFVSWLAGIAGISLPVDGGKPRGSTLQTVLAVLFPPYPIVWMFMMINEQRKFLNKSSKTLHN